MSRDVPLYGFYSEAADRACGHAVYVAWCGSDVSTVHVTLVTERRSAVDGYRWPDARYVGRLGRMLRLVPPVGAVIWGFTQRQRQ